MRITSFGSGFLVAAAALCFGAQGHAQTTLSSSSGAPTITAPTVVQYDAGGPSSISTSWTVTAACDNAGGTSCPVTLAFSSPSNVIPDVQWEFVSTPSGNGCATPLSTGSFRSISAGTAIVTVQNNKSCTLVLAFRAPTLSYTAYTSPTQYVQGVAVIITKP